VRIVEADYLNNIIICVEFNDVVTAGNDDAIVVFHFDLSLPVTVAGHIDNITNQGLVCTGFGRGRSFLTSYSTGPLFKTSLSNPKFSMDLH